MDFKTTIAKLLFMVAVALSIASCSKEADQLTINEESSDAFISAQKEFAKILSSALNEEPDLRAFLKNEALKEFDMDYDVFYPYTKDVVVSGNRTFKDILISHSEDPSSLDRMKLSFQSLPSLFRTGLGLTKMGSVSKRGILILKKCLSAFQMTQVIM